jgi:uncharacterized protein (DUF2461 family)
MIQASTLQFIDDLKNNNNKEWFHENKKRYELFKKEYQTKVSHVGIMLSKTEVIHASGIVRIDTLSKNTMTVDRQFDYQAIAFKRLHS